MESHEARNAIAELIHNDGDLERITELLGEYPNAKPLLNLSWMEYAGEQGRGDLVRYLYENGSSFEESIESGGALAGIVNAGDVEMVSWMLEQGADPNVSGDPITWAVSNGRLDIVKLLVKHGVDINTVFGLPPRTPLSQAILFQRHDIADYLRSLDAKMPPGQEQKEHATPSSAKLNELTEAEMRDEIVESMTYRVDGKLSSRKLDEIVAGKRRIAVHQVLGNSRVIFTVGLSFTPMRVPKGMEDYQHAELAMILPNDWPDFPDPKSHEAWPWRWLRTMAHHPGEHDTWLGAPSSTFANGDPAEPLADSVNFCGFFLRYDMAFDSFESDDGRTIQFMTVMPIYREELELAKRADGDMELMRRFAEHNLSATLDCHRPNVATDQSLPKGNA